jgi:hypothetical protein
MCLIDDLHRAAAAHEYSPCVGVPLRSTAEAFEDGVMIAPPSPIMVSLDIEIKSIVDVPVPGFGQATHCEHWKASRNLYKTVSS